MHARFGDHGHRELLGDAIAPTRRSRRAEQGYATRPGTWVVAKLVADTGRAVTPESRGPASWQIVRKQSRELTGKTEASRCATSRRGQTPLRIRRRDHPQLAGVNPSGRDRVQPRGLTDGSVGVGCQVVGAFGRNQIETTRNITREPPGGPAAAAHAQQTVGNARADKPRSSLGGFAERAHEANAAAAVRAAARTRATPPRRSVSRGASSSSGDRKSVV